MQKIINNYIDESNLPDALCETCRSYVYHAKAKQQKLKSLDLSMFLTIERITRSKNKC